MGDQIFAGFGRADITPEEYMTLAGFGNDERRMCDHVIDRIFGTCVALKDTEGNTVLLCTVDLLNAIYDTVVMMARKAISEATGIPGGHIMVAVTHTHAGPSMYDPAEPRTGRFLAHYCKQMVRAAKDALEELCEAKILIGQRQVKNMTFVRHYLMNDGTFAGPNFGSFESGAKAHLDTADEQLQLIRFVRQSARDIVLVNWQSHCTITGGIRRSDLSADYPGAMRSHVEGSLGCYCAFFQGGAGNLIPRTLVPDQMIVEHDRELYGRKLAEFVLAGLEASMRPAAAGEIKLLCQSYVGIVDHSDDHLAPAAREMFAHLQDFETASERAAYVKQMGFNSSFHARQVLNREKAGYSLELELDAIAIGDISFATVPFEMFCSSGRYIKEHTPFPMTFVMAYCNGSFSYVPDEKAFGYDCYEVNSRRFGKGVAEDIAKTHVRLLQTLNGEMPES